MKNSPEAKKLHVVMYHYIRDLAHSRYPGIKGLDLPLFREQIGFLKQMFRIVTMEEVILAARGKYDLPEDALILTFDDGYIDHYTYAMPVLEENNVQGAFFIPGKTFTEHRLLDVNKIHYILASAAPQKLLSALFERMDYYRGNEFDFPDNKELWAQYGVRAGRFDTADVLFIKYILQMVLPEKLRNRISSDLFKMYVGVPEELLAYELYMTEEQIRAMKRHGMHIGIHGYDHYWLGNLPEAKMEADIDQELAVMDEWIDRNAWVMNYPYGNYNDQVIAYIKNRGCCLGFTTEVRTAVLDRDDPFKLPRLDCNDFPPKSTNYKGM
ncbi:polysaccharide deacetylase [Clostridiaceae bacterium]|nr:polysaccharide deacetylase [Clostridiaceae bacterium]